jgi:hypothetical protein
VVVGEGEGLANDSRAVSAPRKGQGNPLEVFLSGWEGLTTRGDGKGGIASP